MIDLAPYLCPPSGKRYSLRGSFGEESCQVIRESSGYYYQVKNSNAETLWYDSKYIYRGLDTSEGSDECYAQYSTDGSRYGAPWLKRYMNVGESFKRDPMVKHFVKSSGQLRNQGVHVSNITLVALHPTHTFSNGKALNDVVELRWDAGESYFYAKEYGLVGFRGIDGRFSNFDPTWLSNAPVRGVIPWFKEPVPPPTVAAPAWSYPADDANGWKDMIASSTGNITNVRAEPTTTAKAIGSIGKSTMVRINRASTAKMADGMWYPVQLTVTTARGWVRSDVIAIKDVAPLDPAVVKVATPFVSQLGADAARRNNDCGIACALMLYGAELAKLGVRIPRPLTVDACVPYTPLATADKPLMLTALVGLLNELGAPARSATGLTLDEIVRRLDAGDAVIPLVAYHKVNPAGGRFGHYIVVYGYGERGFWAHDPYSLGADIYLTRQQLDEALRETVDVGAAGAPYQGVILT